MFIRILAKEKFNMKNKLQCLRQAKRYRATSLCRISRVFVTGFLYVTHCTNKNLSPD